MKIPVSHGYLEARLRRPAGEPRGAAVVCHAHPLYGGTMHTKAVYRAAEALAGAGLAALRFNFRGVGTSTGSFDGGMGEREDVAAALDHLAAAFPGLRLVAAGFSFGSFVGLAVGREDPRVVALLGLGLPVRLYDFSFLAEVRKPTLVVQGEEDGFGPAGEVRSLLAGAGAVTVETIPGADHLFEGHFGELGAAIRDFFSRGPGGRVLEAGDGGGTGGR